MYGAKSHDLADEAFCWGLGDIHMRLEEEMGRLVQPPAPSKKVDLGVAIAISGSEEVRAEQAPLAQPESASASFNPPADEQSAVPNEDAEPQAIIAASMSVIPPVAEQSAVPDENAEEQAINEQSGTVTPQAAEQSAALVEDAEKQASNIDTGSLAPMVADQTAALDELEDEDGGASAIQRQLVLPDLLAGDDGAGLVEEDAGVREQFSHWSVVSAAEWASATGQGDDSLVAEVAFGTTQTASAISVLPKRKVEQTLLAGAKPVCTSLIFLDAPAHRVQEEHVSHEGTSQCLQPKWTTIMY